MREKLSLKERKFLKTYIKTGNLAKSAKVAGSKGKDTHSLSTVGLRMLKAVEIELSELMDLKGLSDSKLLERLEEGLGAMVVKTATDHGRITDEKTYVDFPSRAKYLEIAGRMKGLLKEKHEVSGKDGKPITHKIIVTYDDDGNGIEGQAS